MNRFIGFFTRYFIQGLIILVPIFIISYVLLSVFSTVGSFIESIGLKIHWLIDPFLGLIIVTAFILGIGFLGSTLFFKPFFVWLEHLIERAPVIKSIYGTLKDLVEAFVGGKKKFNRPVLVQLFDNAERIGFITSEDLSELGISEEKVAVYFPHSYAISGNVMIVSKSKVKPIDMSSAKVYKFLVSGGVA